MQQLCYLWTFVQFEDGLKQFSFYQFIFFIKFLVALLPLAQHISYSYYSGIPLIWDPWDWTGSSLSSTPYYQTTFTDPSSYR